MINKYSIVLITITALIFTSCVSKKKFVEMQTGRLTAEERVRELTDETNTQAERIRQMIADYEDMRNALLENNAIKDSYIDSLNGVVFNLTTELEEQQESMEATSYSYDFENQRLTEALETSDRTIQRLENEIKELENDISSRSSLIDQKNYDIRMMENEIQQLENQVAERDENLEELRDELQAVRTRVDELNTQIQEKDNTITRLQNNVNLLKEELGSEP